MQEPCSHIQQAAYLLTSLFQTPCSFSLCPPPTGPNTLPLQLLSSIVLKAYINLQDPSTGRELSVDVVTECLSQLGLWSLSIPILDSLNMKKTQGLLVVDINSLGFWCLVCKVTCKTSTFSWGNLSQRRTTPAVGCEAAVEANSQAVITQPHSVSSIRTVRENGFVGFRRFNRYLLRPV